MTRTLKKYLSCTFLTLIFIVLLVGCREKTTLEVTQTFQSTSGPTLTLSTSTPFSTQDLIETLKPTISNSALSTRSAIPTAFAKTPTEVYSSPTPYLSPTPIPAALPFHDCVRTPGIVGCAPSAPSLEGHMAFYDAESQRLIGLDLKTGQGWTVLLSKPRALEWSPDGSQLLVQMNFPKDKPYEYLLFEKGGKLIRQFSQDKYMYWQPQGAELHTYDERKIVRSRDGAEAWLETTGKYQKILHFRTSGTGDWKTAALDLGAWELPADLFQWIPGTSKIIITHGPNSSLNDVMHGPDLFLFDIQTGELRYLRNFNGHLDPQFATLHEDNFAIIHLYGGLINDTLAILDGKGDISHPLPRANGEIQGYYLKQIAWRPGKSKNEDLIAMMVNLVRANVPVPVSPLFPKDGIYFYNLTTGEAQIMRELPENILGGNFNWTADGQYLIYTIGPANSPQSTQTNLYAREMNTEKEWLMLDNLINPVAGLGSIKWFLIAVYMEQ